MYSEVCKVVTRKAALLACMALPQVAVSQQVDDNGSLMEVEEVTVYGIHNQLILESGTATKSNMALIETPAAIVVVDGALLAKQANNTLQETLRNVSGLSQDGNNYGVGDNLAIRGLGVNYLYDGIYGGADLGNSYNPTRSLTNISSIEVLKGPATGLYGMGSGGGIINLIEKKPEYESSRELRATLGQWNTYGLMFDATGALTENSAYRLVVNRESTDGYRDLSSERSEIYASLKYNFSASNQLIFSAAYIDDENLIDSIGHPVRLIDLSLIDITDGVTADDLANGEGDALGLELTDEQRQELADSLTTGEGTQPFDIGDASLVSPIVTPNNGEEIRFKVRHDVELTDSWALTQQLQYRNYDTNYIRQTGAFNYIYTDRNGVINLDPRAPLVIDDVLYPYAARRQEYRNVSADESTWQYVADISGHWSANRFRGEHLFSLNYQTTDMSYEQYSIWDADDGRSDPVPYILDIRDPDFEDASFDDFNPVLGSKFDKSVTSYGFSFQEVVYFSEMLTARVGGAYSRVEQSYQNQFSDGIPEYDADDSGVTYNVGVNYRFTDQISAFVNASKGRTAYSVLGSLDGESDRPDSESESFDIGLRFTAFEENLLGSLVFFDTARTNQRYSNPEFEDDVTDPAFNIDVPEYYYDQKDRTEGVEFDLNFVLNEQWSMNVNATYQDAVTEPGVFAVSQEKVPTKGIAEKLAGVWTTYSMEFDSLPAPLDFSLGVNYVDERSIASSSFGIDYAVVPSYTVWDAAIGYTTATWHIQLNLENLANESYYSKAAFLGGIPGEERNARISASYFF